MQIPDVPPLTTYSFYTFQTAGVLALFESKSDAALDEPHRRASVEEVQLRDVTNPPKGGVRHEMSADDSSSQGSGPSQSDLLPRGDAHPAVNNAGRKNGAISDGVHLNVNELQNDTKKRATQLPVPSIRRTRNSVASAPDLEAIIVTEYSVPALTNAHKGSLQPFNACHPLAILLRFRVAQVASGFCTFLLGTSALLDRDTRHSLFLACIAGFLCILSTVMHIIDCRRRGPKGLQYIFPSVHVTLAVILTTISVVACLASCLVYAATSDNRNVLKLAVSQSIALTPWLLIEGVTVVLRVIWARRLVS